MLFLNYMSLWNIYFIFNLAKDGWNQIDLIDHYIIESDNEGLFKIISKFSFLTNNIF